MSTATAAPTLQGLPPSAVLGRIMSGYAASQLIYLAAKLKLAELLESGPQSSEDLAAAAGVRADMLARVMRGLTVLGIVTSTEDGRFQETALSRYLLSDAPGSVRALALCAEEAYPAWNHVRHTMETGQPGFDCCFGMSRFEYLAQHPAASATFNEAMSGMLKHSAAAVVAANGYSGFRRIVDVGGGRGVLISTVLVANPAAHGILFDSANVIVDAEAHIRSSGVADRCDLVAGDFLHSVPPGGDLYLISQTLHNWDDARATSILRNCRQAMAAGGVVQVIEMLMPERLDGSPMNYPLVMTDLQMMIMTGGRERTEAEHRALFKAAGLTLRKIIPTKSLVVILEGVAD